MDKKSHGLRHRYGSVIAAYKEDPKNSVVFALLLLIVGVGFSYDILSDALENGIVAILKPEIFLNFFCGPGMLFIAVLVLSDSFKSRNDGITIYQHGFEYRSSDDTQSRNWRGIEDVDHSVRWKPRGDESRVTTHSFTIRARGKPAIKLSKFPNLIEVGTIIQEKVAEYSVPDALAQIKRPRRLSFGQFQVSLRALSHESVSVPWTELASAELESVWEGSEDETYLGMINIKKKGEKSSWVKVPISDVPNDFLFLQIVQRGIEEEWGKGLSLSEEEIRDVESPYVTEEVPESERQEIPQSELGALARRGWLIGGLVGLVVFGVFYIFVSIFQLTELKTLLVEYWWLLVGIIALIIVIWFMRQVTKGSGSPEKSSDE